MKTIVSNVLYVDLDRSRRGLNDAKQRQSERGLTGSSPSHHADLLNKTNCYLHCVHKNTVYMYMYMYVASLFVLIFLVEINV